MKASKTKLELMELHARFVQGVALATEHAMKESDTDERCRTFVAYLSGFLSSSVPDQAAQFARVCGITEKDSK